MYRYVFFLYLIVSTSDGLKLDFNVDFGNLMQQLQLLGVESTTFRRNIPNDITLINDDRSGSIGQKSEYDESADGKSEDAYLDELKTATDKERDHKKKQTTPITTTKYTTKFERGTTRRKKEFSKDEYLHHVKVKDEPKHKKKKSHHRNMHIEELHYTKKEETHKEKNKKDHSKSNKRNKPDHSESDHGKTKKEYSKSHQDKNKNDYSESHHEKNEPNHSESDHGKTKKEHSKSQHDENKNDYSESHLEKNEPDHSESDHGKSKKDYSKSHQGKNKNDYSESHHKKNKHHSESHYQKNINEPSQAQYKKNKNDPSYLKRQEKEENNNGKNEISRTHQKNKYILRTPKQSKTNLRNTDTSNENLMNKTYNFGESRESDHWDMTRDDKYSKSDDNDNKDSNSDGNDDNKDTSIDNYDIKLTSDDENDEVTQKTYDFGSNEDLRKKKDKMLRHHHRKSKSKKKRHKKRNDGIYELKNKKDLTTSKVTNFWKNFLSLLPASDVKNWQQQSFSLFENQSKAMEKDAKNSFMGHFSNLQNTVENKSKDALSYIKDQAKGQIVGHISDSFKNKTQEQITNVKDQATKEIGDYIINKVKNDTEQKVAEKLNIFKGIPKDTHGLFNIKEDQPSRFDKFKPTQSYQEDKYIGFAGEASKYNGSFHKWNLPSHKVADDERINTFTTHLLAHAMTLFNFIKKRSTEYNWHRGVKHLAEKYEDKMKEFIRTTRDQEIKTKHGSHKVILNTIAESHRIILRLVNMLKHDMDKKGVLNIGRTSNMIDDEIKNTVTWELKRACVELGICRSQSSIMDMVVDVLSSLIKLDTKQFRLAFDSLTEAGKSLDFSQALGKKANKKLKAKINEVENQKLDIKRTMVKIVKNIIDHRHTPVVIYSDSNPLKSNLYSTLSFLEIIDTLDEKVPNSESNIREWQSLRDSMKGLEAGGASIQPVMTSFVLHLKEVMEDVDEASKDVIHQNAKILL